MPGKGLPSGSAGKSAVEVLVEPLNAKTPPFGEVLMIKLCVEVPLLTDYDSFCVRVSLFVYSV